METTIVNYKLRLYQNGITNIFTKSINEDLFTILEHLYYKDYPNDLEAIKIIYSILSDEVDDEDYFDMGYDNDNDDLVDVLFTFCIKNCVGKTELALQLGKFLIETPQRLFLTYEDFHYQLAECFFSSALLPNGYDSELSLSMELNEIVNNDLLVVYSDEHNELLYGNNK